MFLLASVAYVRDRVVTDLRLAAGGDAGPVEVEDPWLDRSRHEG